ncbi:MAG TPA: PAC2 family protein [Acidimicrobiia bacterium]|nr:PAC2 family protein [Acidimicrobiia bacterium]
MLEVDRWPELRDPVLVIALHGWVDAGHAGAGSIDELRVQMAHAQPFARIDLTDVCDLQQTRPTARFVDGGLRVITWPTIELEAGTARRDIVLASGPEASLRWPAVAGAFVDVAQRLGVREAVTIAGMPGFTTHRHPVPVLATATSRALAQESGPLRTDYAGPTGLQTIVQHTLGAAGIPTVGLWAQVPQYVSGSPSPPAVRAVLARLVELFGFDLDLAPLDARCDVYTAKVEEGLHERPDVAAVVDRLDEERAEAPSGEELVSEIERFLRSRPEHD